MSSKLNDRETVNDVNTSRKSRELHRKIRGDAPRTDRVPREHGAPGGRGLCGAGDYQVKAADWLPVATQ